MTTQEIKEFVSEINEWALQADGLDDAIIGYVSGYGMNPRLAYDVDKIIKIFMSQGMEREEAVEYFHYNVLGAYCGDEMPVFVWDLRSE